MTALVAETHGEAMRMIAFIVKLVETFIILSPVIEHMAPISASSHTILAFVIEHTMITEIVTDRKQSMEN